MLRAITRGAVNALGVCSVLGPDGVTQPHGASGCCQSESEKHPTEGLCRRMDSRGNALHG